MEDSQNSSMREISDYPELGEEKHLTLREMAKRDLHKTDRELLSDVELLKHHVHCAFGMERLVRLKQAMTRLKILESNLTHAICEQETHLQRRAKGDWYEDMS
jgi:hypothetical protein